LTIYQCFIRGENFPGMVIGEDGLVGFFTTRWVEASDEVAAEQVTLARLKDESLFEVAPEFRNSEARVYFDKIVAVAERPSDIIEGGATWFPMEE
jgi:hypothetical protein